VGARSIDLRDTKEIQLASMRVRSHYAFLWPKESMARGNGRFTILYCQLDYESLQMKLAMRYIFMSNAQAINSMHSHMEGKVLH